MVTDYYNKFC